MCCHNIQLKICDLVRSRFNFGDFGHFGTHLEVEFTLSL